MIPSFGARLSEAPGMAETLRRRTEQALHLNAWGAVPSAAKASLNENSLLKMEIEYFNDAIWI